MLGEVETSESGPERTSGAGAFGPHTQRERSSGRSNRQLGKWTFVMPKRGRRSVRALTMAGCACLIVVVLTHVAERISILPGMGWGLPDSPGHYLDLIAAMSGVGLLVAAGLAHFFVRVRGGN